MQVGQYARLQLQLQGLAEAETMLEALGKAKAQLEQKYQDRYLHVAW